MAPYHRIDKRGRRGGSRHAGRTSEPGTPLRPPSPDDPIQKASIEASHRPGRPAIHRTAASPTIALPRAGGEWIYGRHAVAAALGNPLRRVRQVVALAEASAPATELVASARARLPAEPQPLILPRETFEALLPGGAVHQGIALAAAPLPSLAIEDIIDRAGTAPGDGEAPQIVVLLDQVSDPHNVGAVLRSAAAFGALALVIPEHGAPPVTGVLAKAASGAIELVPIVRVVNLARTMDRLKSAGFWCLGLDETAERALPDLSLGGRLALVLGAEGDGMRRLTRERCDLIARLPTLGAMASLNVSNAAAVALYELTRAAALAEPNPRSV
jgi:23S rRNA (guanosine2251-2'-O)-methyltransferase